IPTVLKEGQWKGKLAIISLHGKITPTFENIFLIQDESGNPLCLADVITDITELKQVEVELKKHRDNLAELVEERTREIHQLARENFILAEIGRVITSSIEIEEVYDKFVEKVRELIFFDRIAINLIDYAKEEIKIAYVSGKEVPGRESGKSFPLAGFLEEFLSQFKEALIFQGEAESEWESKHPALLPIYRSGIRSLILVPLYSRGKLIGTFHIESLSLGVYTERDLSVGQRIGDQIAGAIANAELFLAHERLEEEREKLERQFWQSQKLESVGRLAGGIAHDFNNLLTVVSVQSELGLRLIRRGDPLQENFLEIKKAAERAADLTRKLLAFSRRQIMEPKVVDLNFIIGDMENMIKRIIGEDIELECKLGEGLGKVKVDVGQIEQVIMNLAVNAREAMLGGGKLTIETANVELDEGYRRRHGGVMPGEYVMLAESDSGVGMSEEVREQIFEPFFTTKAGGTGLG
ncbi:MAG: GAF domain-containing protein, partial [Desulfobacterota bacterium]|nr:GAF domain-containing protein [Thermodesulfobacteriota bacterium]